MGLPVPGYHIEIVDDDGNILKTNEEGQIAIRTSGPTKPAAGLFVDYWKEDSLTNKVFKHGWYYTQDTGYKDSDGYIWFVGRADDVFKSSGYRIGPFEVESVLLEHEAVAEAAVVPAQDPEEVRGLVVKAYVVLALPYKNKGGTGLIGELQEHVKNRTAPYKYPRIIEFVEELPKTISGKIRRTELRTRTVDRYDNNVQ